MTRLAFSALGRVQENPKAIPGTVLSSNAPIEVDVSPDSEIEITDVKLSAGANTFGGGSFTIRNMSNKDLLAYEVAMNVYYDTDPNRPLQMRLIEDGWFLNQYILKPGQSTVGVIRSSVTSKTPVKISRVTVVPEYVEFAGTHPTGTNISQVGAVLAKSRDMKANVLRKYAAQMKIGESPSSVAEQIKSDMQTAARLDSAQRIGMSELLTILKLEGPEGLGKRLTEPAASRAF